MASVLHTIEQVRQLTGINNVSISEIHRRARPLEDKFEDPDGYRVRSHQGFLAPGQSLTDCILADWDVVIGHGWTHIDVADALRHVIALAESERSKNKWGMSRDIHLATRTADLVPAALKPNMNHMPKEQKFTVSHKFYIGYQWSIFCNESNPESDESTMKWKDEYIITNDALAETGISLLIAGNAEAGILSWIHKYGFYEGGDSNQYRLDPELVVATLTGRVTAGTVEALSRRLHCQIATIDSELAQIRKSFPDADSVELADLESRRSADKATLLEQLSRAKQMIT